MCQIIDFRAEKRRRERERARDLRAGECVMDYAALLRASAEGQKFLSEYDADNLLPCDVE